jgi:hypothetical protein
MKPLLIALCIHALSTVCAASAALAQDATGTVRTQATAKTSAP